MESQIETRLQPSTIVLATPCEHGRLIDEVLTRGGTRTGKVRCLECGAVFDDPYLHQK